MRLKKFIFWRLYYLVAKAFLVGLGDKFQGTWRLGEKWRIPLRVGDKEEQIGGADGDKLTWSGSVIFCPNFLGSSFEFPSSALHVRELVTSVKSSQDCDICIAEWISRSWATSLPATSIHSSCRSWFTRGVNLGPP